MPFAQIWNRFNAWVSDNINLPINNLLDTATDALDSIIPGNFFQEVDNISALSFLKSKYQISNKSLNLNNIIDEILSNGNDSVALVEYLKTLGLDNAIQYVLNKTTNSITTNSTTTNSQTNSESEQTNNNIMNYQTIKKYWYALPIIVIVIFLLINKKPQRYITRLPRWKRSKKY